MDSSVLTSLEFLINESISSNIDGFEMSVEPEDQGGKVNDAYKEPIETDFDVENGDQKLWVSVKLRPDSLN